MFLALCKSMPGFVLQWQGEFYYAGKFSRPHGFKKEYLDFHSVYRHLEEGRPLNSYSSLFYTQNWSEGPLYIAILIFSYMVCQRKLYGSQTTEISRKMFIFEHELLWRRSSTKVREGYILNLHVKAHYRPS